MISLYLLKDPFSQYTLVEKVASFYILHNNVCTLGYCVFTTHNFGKGDIFLLWWTVISAPKLEMVI